jgi:hypothetical protein
MTRSCLSSSILVLSLTLAGCGGEAKDSLATERAAMEAEKQAMAAHKQEPVNAAPAERGSSLSKPPSQQLDKPGDHLPAGTRITVIVSQALSSKSAGTGDDWLSKLAEDLKTAEGKVLVKAGSDVKGRIVLVSDGTRLRRRHELEIRLYRLQPPSGDPVDIRTTSIIRAGADEGSRPAIIESGSRLEFQLASETIFRNK